MPIISTDSDAFTVKVPPGAGLNVPAPICAPFLTINRPVLTVTLPLLPASTSFNDASVPAKEGLLLANTPGNTKKEVVALPATSINSEAFKLIFPASPMPRVLLEIIAPFEESVTVFTVIFPALPSPKSRPLV